MTESTPPSEPVPNVAEAPAIAPQISAASVKLPPFWKESPSLWFNIIEAQFEVANIVTDKTKYNYILSILYQNLAKVVDDILSNPPATDRYGTLKESLISRLSASESSQINRLLEDVDMGDRTPSQFLRELRQLAQDKVSDNFLKSIWLKRLPEKIRLILASHHGPLDQLAKSADQIFDLVSAPAVYATSKQYSQNTELELLRQDLQQLTQQFQALCRSRSRSSSRPQSRSNSRHNAFANKNTSWCWYHKKFATKAIKCIPPCTFIDNKPK